MRGLVLALGLAVAPAVRAQQAPALELTLRDGRVLEVEGFVGTPAAGYDARSGGKSFHFDAAEVLFVHGAAAVRPDLPTAYLKGGEVVRGAFAGGDAGGNHVELLSPCLGRVLLNVDRVAAIVTTNQPPAAFVLPDGVDEALFVPASIGFDIQGGTLFQFGAEGVRFQPAGRDGPRWFASREFAALRLRGAVARTEAAGAELWTRAGDHLGVDVIASTADALRCRLEGGVEVPVRWSDVACLGARRDVTWLSGLTPSAVRESGFDGDVVYPWRRDEAVTGEPLVAGGHTHGTGLGVHSRSSLSFTVPPGVATFWTRVALAASAGALPVQANVEVRVLRNDKQVFQASLTPASAPADTGLVAVKAGDTLSLEVDFGSGRDLGDRVNWLSPVLLPASGHRP